jgi:protein TonB
MMRITRAHWIVAVATAAVVHAAVTLAILRQDRPASAHGAGVGGIEIALGPAGGAAGTKAAAAAPPPEEPPVAEKEPESVPPVVEKEPEPEPEKPPVVETEPVEAPPAERNDVAVQHDALPPPLPEILEPIEPIEKKPEPEPAPHPVKESVRPPEPEPQPEPVKPVVEPKTVEAPPPPKAKPNVPKVPEPFEVAKTPDPRPEPPPKHAETRAAMSAPSVSGTEGKAGTRDSRNTGSAEDSSGGGIPGEMIDYMALLQAWLERHKEYPRGARLRRIEGTTLLYFVMDRSGTVIDYRIQKSSGHAMLDHEVEAMIERAQPLPAIPQDMNRQRLELVVPVQFLLR